MIRNIVENFMGMVHALEDHDKEFGCLYGAACCMMGPHFPSECYTAEMIEEYAEQSHEPDPKQRAGKLVV